MRQHVASFANFICRFGRDKVLLDYAEQIVLPAFTDDTLIRSYGKGRTHFFFYETQIVELEKNDREPVLAITGRFIKNTQLSREQIFDPDKGVVKDTASLATAPSAFFMLILNSHRLIYFPETAHAPDLKSFKSTAIAFIKKKHKDFIHQQYIQYKETENPVTKKQLVQTHPHPSLEVIPISGDEDIEKFVRRYGVLKKIEFKVVQPNDEIDAGEMFNEIREFLGPMQPTDTKLIASRSEGFDLDEALPRIKDASETANQEIKLSGKDTEGNDLKGDNHEFKVGAPIEPLPVTRQTLTDKLFSTFKELIANGTIKTGNFADDVAQKIINLKDIL